MANHIAPVVTHAANLLQVNGAAVLLKTLSAVVTKSIAAQMDTHAAMTATVCAKHEKIDKDEE